MTKPEPKLDPEEPTAGFFAAPTLSPFEERQIERRHLDTGRYVPKNTKLDRAEYCDPIFRDRGMIGTLENRQAILAGPFVWRIGCLPQSHVIWVPPTKAKIVINEIAVTLQAGGKIDQINLYNGEYFDGAVSSPQTFEDRIREAWNRRYLDHQRFLINTIDAGRYCGGRRRVDGTDQGMKNIVWDTVATHELYDTLTEKVWEAGGYGN